MDRTPSKSLPGMWMAGWLALMLIVVVAGREGMRELNVFQLMFMRTIIGFFLLYPLIRAKGGFSVVKTARIHMHIARNLIHYGAQLGWFFALTLIRSRRLADLFGASGRLHRARRGADPHRQSLEPEAEQPRSGARPSL